MITVTTSHDLRRMKKNGLYPVKLRVTYNRRSKYFETGIQLSKENFDKLSSKHLGKDLVLIKKDLVEMEGKASIIIKSVKPFNFPVFSEKFSQKKHSIIVRLRSIYNFFRQQPTLILVQRGIGNNYLFNT
ncbi:MAG: Arm DNA-binding domain-containing protein [Ginsengibacter sp.]